MDKVYFIIGLFIIAINSIQIIDAPKRRNFIYYFVSALPYHMLKSILLKNTYIVVFVINILAVMDYSFLQDFKDYATKEDKKETIIRHILRSLLLWLVPVNALCIYIIIHFSNGLERLT